MGRFFWKKSLNVGQIFHEKIPDYESVFQNNFVAKSQEIGTYFRKNPQMWVPIFGKIIPEHGYASWTAGSTSPTNPNLEYPPPQTFIPGGICLHKIQERVAHRSVRRTEPGPEGTVLKQNAQARLKIKQNKTKQNKTLTCWPSGLEM